MQLSFNSYTALRQSQSRQSSPPSFSSKPAVHFGKSEPSKGNNLLLFFALLGATFGSAFGLDRALQKPEPSNPEITQAAQRVDEKRNKVLESLTVLKEIDTLAGEVQPVVNQSVAAMQTLVDEITKSTQDAELKAALTGLPPLTDTEKAHTAQLLRSSLQTNRTIRNRTEVQRIFRQWTNEVLRPHLKGEMVTKLLGESDRIFKEADSWTDHGWHLSRTIDQAMLTVQTSLYKLSSDAKVDIAKDKAVAEQDSEKAIAFYLSQIELEVVQQSGKTDWAKLIANFPELTDQEKQKTLALFKRDELTNSPLADQKRFNTWMTEVIEPRIGHEKTMEIIQASDTLFQEMNRTQRSSEQWLKASAWGVLMLVFGGFTVAQLLKKKQ